MPHKWGGCHKQNAWVPGEMLKGCAAYSQYLQTCGQWNHCKNCLQEIDKVQYSTSCFHGSSKKTLGISRSLHHPSISLPLSPPLPTLHLWCGVFYNIHIYYITWFRIYPPLSTEECISYARYQTQVTVGGQEREGGGDQSKIFHATIRGVWEIGSAENTENTLFFQELKNISCKRRHSRVCFFSVHNTHSSVRFQLMSHMVGIH